MPTKEIAKWHAQHPTGRADVEALSQKHWNSLEQLGMAWVLEIKKTCCIIEVTRSLSCRAWYFYPQEKHHALIER